MVTDEKGRKLRARLIKISWVSRDRSKILLFDWLEDEAMKGFARRLVLKQRHRVTREMAYFSLRAFLNGCGAKNNNNLPS